MRVNGRIFDAATRYYAINRALQSIAGSGYWFAEFQPVNFIGLSFMYNLLKYLFGIYIYICCHASGAYPSYLAGFQTSFAGATIFIAPKEHPFINLIFQLGEETLQIFHMGPFKFILFEDVDDMDVCRYHVKLGEYTMPVTFIGVDSGIPCGTQSKVDFVKFIWLDNNMLGFRRHALTFLPILHDHGRLLCLRHYRVASMGWNFISGCPMSGAFSRESALVQHV
jgi:hypothetical protein